jgi:uncharacterized protein YdaU (DUF1376 family)
MSAPPYMKLYVADYLGDTHHLGVIEHGAYLLLLMAMWRAGGSLPAADANLAKLARCTPDQWTAIRGDVLPFFKQSRAKLTHKRLSEELAKYENTSGKRSEASNARVAKKGRNSNALPSANADDPNSNCTHNQNQNQKEYTTTINAGDWRRMLDEAKEAAGDAADLTRPAMHHAADLRALVEPHTGEPCTWGEVLDAIAMTAMRQKARGKLIPTWKWVQADAIALRDKRLNAVNPEAAEVVPLRATGPPNWADQQAAINAEARRRVLES